MALFLRYQILSGMLMVGLYTVDLLAVVMTILTSVDTISGEITSGTIHAIATKPRRALAGALRQMDRLCRHAGRLRGADVRRDRRRWATGSAASCRKIRVAGAMLVFLECVLALTVTLLFGTWFSTLTNGVIVLGLHGLAFHGRVDRADERFRRRVAPGDVGIVSSLVMPSEAIWRRAAFDGVAAGRLAAIFTLCGRLRAQRHDDRLCRILSPGHSGSGRVPFSTPRFIDSGLFSASARQLSRLALRAPE